jgi:hypothetical protein
VLACWRLSSVSMSGAVSVGKAAGRRGGQRNGSIGTEHTGAEREVPPAEQPHGMIQDGAYSDLHHNASRRRETRQRRAYLMEMRARRRGREGAPTGRLEGHRTGKIGRDVWCRVCILQPSGSRAGKGGVGRRLITTLHMQRLATGARRLLELIQRVPGGRGQQGRARYGRGGSRCAGGEASIPGQSTSTRTGRNVSTCAQRSESEISAVAGGRGEGGGPQDKQRKPEAGRWKQEAGTRLVGQAMRRG